MKGRLKPILLVLGVAALIVAPLGRTDTHLHPFSWLIIQSPRWGPELGYAGQISFWRRPRSWGSARIRRR